MTEVLPDLSDRSPEALQSWLIERLSAYLDRPADELEPDALLSEYGLDSVHAVTVSAEIGDHLGVELDATVLWDYPSIATLSSYLSDRLSDRPGDRLGAGRAEP